MNSGFFVLLGKRTLPVVTMTILCAGSLWAQPDGQMGPPPDGPQPGELQQQQSRGPSLEKELKQLSQLLALTTEQQSQVKALLTDQRQQVETLMASTRPAAASDKSNASNGDFQPPSREAMEAMHTAMKSIRAAT